MVDCRADTPFLTDNPKMIHKIKEFVSVEDFCELLDTFICSPHSTGKVGGKATGFFIAYQIIKNILKITRY